MTANQSGAKRARWPEEDASSKEGDPPPPAAVPERSQALADVARNHHSAMVRLLTLRTGSKEDAKEILQEAYAKLLALDRPGTFSVLAGYLWRIAVNLSIDRHRQRVINGRYRHTLLASQKKQEPSAESVAEDRQRLAIIERAISELPARCMEAFSLYVPGDLTFEEVGKEMGISDRMAKKHVARALEYLQHCLDNADRTRRTL